MYFRSLINEELKHFHGLMNVKNFSISLSEILQSNLFKVDRISENICKIYPLFYCKEIISDDNSKILENKCILTSISDEEKYFNFISNSDVPVIYDAVLDYYGIGDKINTADFNAYIQLLRERMSLVDNINVNNGNVDGIYGSYIFNLDDVTIVDNGILITEETLSANPTVRLVNPVFKNSTYTLKLDVFSISDVNIMDDYISDNITHDTLEIVLEENTNIALPLGSLEFNRIVRFNATIDIVHDQPIIQLPGHLTLSSETDNYIDTSISFTVVYEDEVGTPISRETVILRDGETVLDTKLTDEEGIATFEYLPAQDKEYDFNVVNEEGLVSNYIVTDIIKHSVDISLNSDKKTAYIPTTFNINGIVSSDYGVVKNATLNVMNNNQLLETIYSNSVGEYSLEIQANSVTNYNLQIVYEGNSINYSGVSDYVSVTARKLNNSITINTNRSTVYYTQNVTISGVLTDELGNKIANATVKLYNGSSLVATGTTNSNGAYSFTRNWSQGTYNFKVIYEGDNSHNSVTSATKTVYMNKAPTVVNATIPGEFKSGDSYPIKVTSSYGSFNPSSVTVKLYNYNQRPQQGSWIDNPIETITVSEKDANGNFNLTIPNCANNYYDIVIKYNGDNNYAASSKEGSIYIIEADVGSITLSRPSNNVFRALFKDNDGNILKNTSLTIITIYFTINGNESIMELNNPSTNNNGTIDFTVNMPGSGSMYWKYADITSNTVTY